MLDKLFSIKKHDNKRTITVLGIKITKSDNRIKTKISKMQNDYSDLKRVLYRRFLWTNREKFTTMDNIRKQSQYLYSSSGYYPNYYIPKTFNEKITWISYNFLNPDSSRIYDKITFKDYIEEKLGKGYTANILKIYNNETEIDLDELPEQFVIKASKGSFAQQVEVVKDKSKCDVNKLKYKCSNALCGWQNPQSNKVIKVKIFAEEYIKDLDDSSNDYKFYCFHGVPKCFYVANNYATNKRKELTMYDMDFNKMPIHYDNHPQSNVKKLPKPKNFDKMVEIAEKLSSPFPFVRIDLYNAGDRILVGEMTFLTGGGYGSYKPIEWEYKLGEWIDLSKIPPENLKILPEFKEGAKNFIDSSIVDKCAVEEV